MCKRDVGVIAFKVGGLYLLLQALLAILHVIALGLSILFSTASTRNDFPLFSDFLALGIVQQAFLLVSAWILLTGAEYLINLVFRAESTKEPDLATDAAAAQTIAFSVVGLLLAALAVPDIACELFRIIFKLMQPSFAQIFGPREIERSWEQLVPQIFQFALGIWLSLGARSLSDFWWRIQHSREIRNEAESILPDDADGPESQP